MSQIKSMQSQKVVIAMLKELNITEYEPRVISQLLEFTYRYITCILDDAKVYASHAKKKTIDLEDVMLAISLQLDRVFTSPPSRDILLDIARSKNNNPLPIVKPHCGIRLPPDRYCLNSCNYKLKSINANTKKSKPFGHQSQNVSASYVSGGQSTMKISTKTASLSLVKRPGSITTIPRTQSITAPKPVIKFSAGGMSTSGAQKLQVKPKIQMSTGQMPSGSVEVIGQNVKIEVDDMNNPLKRKRDDESQFDDYEQHT